MTIEYIKEINDKVPFEWQRRYIRANRFLPNKVICIAGNGKFEDLEYRIKNIIQDEPVTKKDFLADDYYICTKYGEYLWKMKSYLNT